MIKWNDFANRRNINIENLKHLTYEQYVEYCKHRRVIPISRSEFSLDTKVKDVSYQIENVTTVLNAEPIIEIPVQQIAVQVNPINFRTINKEKKKSLQAMCEFRGIPFTDETTRNELIELLKISEGV